MKSTLVLFAIATSVLASSIVEAADGRLFLLGVGYKFGFNPQIQSDTWMDEYVAGTYDVATGEFADAKLPWQPSSFDDSALVTLNGGVEYILSQYRTAYSYTNGVWRKLPALASVGKRHSSVAIGDRVYVCGGCGCAENRSCEYYSATEPRWQHTAKMTRNRYDHCVTQFDGKMFVFAGRQLGDNAKLTQVEIYSPASDTWTDGALTLPTFTKCTAVLYHDTILVCGYNSGQPSHCVSYNPRTHTHERASTPTSEFGNGVVGRLGLLTVEGDTMYWLDNARGVYTYDEGAKRWVAQRKFNVKEVNGLPEDIEPRAVIGH